MKPLMKTAKELAFKAYCSNIPTLHTMSDYEIKERFEFWWSNNYGNRDTVQFDSKYILYIEGKKHIQAE